MALDSKTPGIANTINTVKTHLGTMPIFMMGEIILQENRLISTLSKMSRKVDCMIKIHQRKVV